MNASASLPHTTAPPPDHPAPPHTHAFPLAFTRGRRAWTGRGVSLECFLERRESKTTATSIILVPRTPTHPPPRHPRPTPLAHMHTQEGHSQPPAKQHGAQADQQGIAGSGCVGGGGEGGTRRGSGGGRGERLLPGCGASGNTTSHRPTRDHTWPSRSTSPSRAPPAPVVSTHRSFFPSSPPSLLFFLPFSSLYRTGPPCQLLRRPRGRRPLSLASHHHGSWYVLVR